MSDDKLRRLRQLGVVRGVRNLKPAPPRQQQEAYRSEEYPSAIGDGANGGQALEVLLPGGHLVETEVGACFVLDHVYPLTFQHGDDHLEGLTTLPMTAAASFCQDDRLTELSYRDYLFLDTETTGLYGAGTIAFMVGVAYFDEDEAGGEAFIVRQLFLRDHGDEPAMLHLLSDMLAERAGLITFNGRTFDLPLLDTRFMMNSMDGLVGDLRQFPHIDLLPPSRRLWRSRLGSCSLSSLEKNLLGLNRTHEDVPGWIIPGLYMDYLRTRDAHELVRVFYHNRIDMLSMATLAGRIIQLYDQPQPGDHALDLFSLAKWHIALGQNSESENILRQIASQDLPLALYHQTLHQLGALLKRQGRREEAVELWHQLAVTSMDDISAHIELAKQYEWHDKDLEKARDWTRAALDLISKWPPSNATLVQGELQHRLTRLEARIARLLGS